MERHHKAAVLSSSSSNPASAHRNPAKRCIWWSTKIHSVIQSAGIVLFIICFLWCLWRLPQDHDAYPDGLRLCPPSSYTLQDGNNITISCIPCIECPSGQQTVPPCGSTVQSDALVECRICPANTYKEVHGIGMCKPCRTCGLRPTIGQCTSENNTQCGECPRGYYQEDYTIDSCKKCSTCCRIKRFAELECIYLKQCKRTNCTQQIENDKRHVPKLEKVSKMFTTTGRITHQRRMIHRSISQSDNSEGARNWVFEENVSKFKTEKIRRDVNMTIQSADTVNYATKGVKEEITTPKDDNSSPPTTATVDGDGTAISFTTQSKSQEGLDTVPDYSASKPTLPLTSSYLSNLLLTILIALVSIAIVLLILIAALIAWKRQSGHLPGSGYTVTCCVRNIYLRDEEYLPVLRDTTPQTESDFQEVPLLGDSVVDTSDKRDYNNGANTGKLESLALSVISIDLENILIKKLDVKHKGEYGWQKVGRAFKIAKYDLEYLETAYSRPVESPTKELLEILKSQCRTVGELINKLKSSEVNRPDIAWLIRQHITMARS